MTDKAPAPAEAATEIGAEHDPHAPDDAAIVTLLAAVVIVVVVLGVVHLIAGVMS